MKKKRLAEHRNGCLPIKARAYEIAKKVGFGDESSLVVLDGRRAYHKCAEKIDRRYRNTFVQPHFNPRWEYGSADYIRFIKI